MRLLLDTHAAVWFAQADPQLSDAARLALFAPDNEALLSAIVCWEVAIKRALGKWDVPADYDEALLAAGAQPLAVERRHAKAVEWLPHHHRDPFDRLLIAQAQLEGATIVTDDPAITRYDVPVLW